MDTNKNSTADILRLFEVRTANQVLKDAFLTPDPIELYPPLIIQGELVILFADTGIGKTALIVQIGIHIVYFGETDHVIPWQTDHLICWRTNVANAIEALTKVVI